MTVRARSSRTWVSPPVLILALWGTFFSWGAPVLAATGNGDLTDSNISYVGRWDRSNSTTYKSYWGGAYLATKFTGRTAQVKLANQTNLHAVIDGVATTYSWVSGTVNLTPTPLASGTHTLQIVARADTDELQFQGLVLDAGASTLAPDSRPLVEFIGDSITSGWTDSNGAMSDYAWQTGERLGAEHVQIAYQGITLADGHFYPGSPEPGMESAFFKLMQVNHCTDVACPANPAWNFSTYTPRLVVVNLGTNDQNAGSINSATTPADFQGRYTTFLQNIRAKYPNADIFAMRTLNGYYAQETQAAVNARVSAGDTKVHFINTTGWLPYSQTDFNDGFHPSDAGHLKVANLLVPVLLPYLGVTTVNDTQFSFDNAGYWSQGWQTGAYQNDSHWSNIADASYQVPFSGTQVKLYGARAPWNGIAAVSIDGGTETNVDTYAATNVADVLLWSSPVLAAGPHSLKVRVARTHNVNSSSSYITADRVDVVNGGINLLSNPGFENGLSGWGLVASAASQAYADTSSPRSGTSYLTHRSATPYWAATYQTLTGLSNGLYTVKAWVRGSGGQQLYAKNYGGAQMSTAIAASDAYTQVVISNVNVTNGNVEIGFWSNDAQGGSWLSADDVTFYKQ
ncbi:MAG: GDSL-type esterase/lipase family protein [Burkholderiales bacterium]